MTNKSVSNKSNNTGKANGNDKQNHQLWLKENFGTTVNRTNTKIKQHTAVLKHTGKKGSSTYSLTQFKAFSFRKSWQFKGLDPQAVKILYKRSRRSIYQQQRCQPQSGTLLALAKLLNFLIFNTKKDYMSDYKIQGQPGFHGRRNPGGKQTCLAKRQMKQTLYSSSKWRLWLTASFKRACSSLTCDSADRSFFSDADSSDSLARNLTITALKLPLACINSLTSTDTHYSTGTVLHIQ